MKRLKTWGLVLLISVIAVAFLFLGSALGNAQTAHAEEVEAPVEDEAPDETPTEGGALQTLVDGFIAELRTKYGEDYETYYNAIISEWGSVEAYLLSLVPDGTPDAVADGWKAFVAWLREYSPVWGSILAIGLVIVVILFGKKALAKLTEWVTGMGKKFKTVFSSMNKLYQHNIATGEAIVKLLGDNPRFDEAKAEIKKAIEDMKKDEEKGGRANTIYEMVRH